MTSKPHSEPSGVVGYTTREFEGGEWVRVEVHEELADRCLSLEEQYQTLREAVEAYLADLDDAGWASEQPLYDALKGSNPARRPS